MHTAGLRATFLALTVAFAATLIFLAPASATSSKPYSIVICGGGQTGCTSANPAVTAPGGTAASPSSLSVTFTNDNKLGSGIELGSDNLNVPSTPAGFAVTGVTLPSGAAVPTCPASFNSSAPTCVTLINGGTTVGFRNLNLAPGQSISFEIAAATPPPSSTACTTTSPCLWTDDAKQSNDFNGTGNDLNSDSNSAYGTVTTSAASCAKNKGCSTTLADGGTAAGTSTGSPGSVSVTVTTASGKTAVTQIEALDFGTPLDPNLCSGVTAIHEEYWTFSTGGTDRSQTVSITTTPYSEYQAEVCLFTSKPFTQLVLTDGAPTALAPATATTVDGTPGFQGLLPDCGTNPLPPLTVNCAKNPGVEQRGTLNPDGTRTSVIAVPAGFDAHSYQ